MDVDPTFDPEFVEIEVNLKNHEFGFGSLIVDDYITDPGFKTYQNIFYEFFNWGTVQSYKWDFNKGTRVSNLKIAFVIMSLRNQDVFSYNHASTV